MQSLRKRLRELWKNWLNRRIPATRQLSLGHRSIFIVPTKAGFLFLSCLLVMLLTGINYQNSLIFALVFWLFSLSLVTMLLTFRNLAGLRIRAGVAPACFVGDSISLPLFLQGNGREHESLYLSFAQQEGVLVRAENTQEQAALLSCQATQRGALRVGRIAIESRYPFGLFRAWSWIQLEFHGVVYPRPEASPMIFADGTEDLEQQDNARHYQQGEEDFHGLRNYQSGDSLKRIAWKQVAQGKGIISKEFAQPSSAECMFSFNSLANYPIETRLSRLCAWVLEAEERGWRYGLELPERTLSLNSGAEHVKQCLTALAFFKLEKGHPS